MVRKVRKWVLYLCWVSVGLISLSSCSLWNALFNRYLIPEGDEAAVQSISVTIESNSNTIYLLYDYQYVPANTAFTNSTTLNGQKITSMRLEFQSENNSTVGIKVFYPDIEQQIAWGEGSGTVNLTSFAGFVYETNKSLIIIASNLNEDASVKEILNAEW